MSAQDPLSEAREALRIIADGMQHAPSIAQVALARLDALPAPVRIRKATLGPKSDGWFYPDAPVAREDGGET